MAVLFYQKLFRCQLPNFLRLPSKIVPLNLNPQVNLDLENQFLESQLRDEIGIVANPIGVFRPNLSNLFVVQFHGRNYIRNSEGVKRFTGPC